MTISEQRDLYELFVDVLAQGTGFTDIAGQLHFGNGALSAYEEAFHFLGLLPVIDDKTFNRVVAEKKIALFGEQL